MYKVGDRIACWSKGEMIHKEYELIRHGIWAERDPKQANCLVITRVREDDDNEEQRHSSRL